MNKLKAYESIYEDSNYSKKIKDEFNLLDENITKNVINMDLRDNVSPQIYEIISSIIEVIEGVEKNASRRCKKNEFNN